MTRFPGWTEKAIAGLNVVHETHKPCPISGIEQVKVVVKHDIPDHPGMIQSALQVLGFSSVREYEFLEDRKFRFDLAIPELKIAIEYEGGIFEGGRHVRGKGYSKDCKKYNLAVLNGWRVLRYTPDVTRLTNWEYRVAMEIIGLIKTIQNDPGQPTNDNNSQT